MFVPVAEQLDQDRVQRIDAEPCRLGLDASSIVWIPALFKTASAMYDRLLMPSINVASDGIDAKPEGTSPVKRLLRKFRLFKRGLLAYDAGMDPLKKFW